MTEAKIRIASLVDRAWLTATARHVVHWFDAESGRVKAVRREMYDDLVLAEHPIEPEAEAAARVLAEAYLARGLRDDDEQVVRRLRFAGRAAAAEDVKALVERACQAGWMRGARTLDAIDLAAHLTHDDARDLARLAPDTLRVPSGGRRASSIRRTAASARRSSCRNCSGSPRRLASALIRRRWCCNSSRRTAGRCRRRAICGASGTARIPRCARSCAGGIRSIPGRMIPGRRPRPTAPNRAGESRGAVKAAQQAAASPRRPACAAAERNVRLGVRPSSLAME